MIKSLSKILIISSAAALLLISSLVAAKNEIITGTVGKEHMVGDKLVICELGTQACMFLDVDPNLQIKIDGKEYKPRDLQVGWYVQATVEYKKDSQGVIKRLMVDPRKTVICFTELNDKQNDNLQKQLKKVKGIQKVEMYLKSKQAYIEYDPQIISYQKIEKIIVDAGYKIE